MRIGRVLRDARERAGLDIPSVEERTKIRGKYLRALEDEEWAVLPSAAYAKGFLRTYASLLGLDGEVLVDEFRRQVDGGRDAAEYPLREQRLAGRRAGDPAGPRPALVLAIAALVVLGVVLFLGLTGGEEEEPPAGRGGASPAKEKEGKAGDRNRGEPAGSKGSVRLALAIGSPVEVCLLDASKRELIDGQVIAAGTEEGPWEDERFELRFPSGYDRDEVRLELDGKPAGLPRAKGAAAFRIDAGGAHPAQARRAEECP
jgi:hypothetical protein